MQLSKRITRQSQAQARMIRAGSGKKRHSATFWGRKGAGGRGDPGAGG